MNENKQQLNYVISSHLASGNKSVNKHTTQGGCELVGLISHIQNVFPRPFITEDYNFSKVTDATGVVTTVQLVSIIAYKVTLSPFNSSSIGDNWLAHITRLTVPGDLQVQFRSFPRNDQRQ